MKPSLKLSIKNIALIFAALIFGASILGTSVVRTTAQTTFNKEKVMSTPEATVSASKVNYYLPYPGILPDHTLYPLKMLRDRIVLFLTTDPVKKAETLLLFADKRLGAGRALIEGGKIELGVSTMTKAEKYLDRAIVQAKKAKQSGKETKALYQKLAQAALKHQEVLNELITTATDSQIKPSLDPLLHYSQQGYEAIRQGN